MECSVNRVVKVSLIMSNVQEPKRLRTNYIDFDMTLLR